MVNLLGLVPVRLLSWVEEKLLGDYERTLSFVTSGGAPAIMQRMANKKLEHAFYRALRTPAYVDFLRKHGIAVKKMSAAAICESIPTTNKHNYIKQYSLERRCISGKFPHEGNIDESAGSTGIPTDWVRDVKEERSLLKAIAFEYRYLFNSRKQVMVISAWSSGPWATGIKFCELMEQLSLVKNTGTNVDDIMRTLSDFGKGYHYVISGYPFFLQSLFEMSFPWEQYDIDIITGGDGYGPLWPAKIKKKLKPGAKIVSAYGCSDIDIGIAFESPFAQAIREEAAQNEPLSQALFSRLQTTPMLFQYNPAAHYVHNLHSGEFAVTHLDSFVASPKIKYNVKDVGGSIPYETMMTALQEHAAVFFDEYKEREMLHLPFLYVAGRRDGTLSFDGANIYPENIDVVFSRHFEGVVRRFKMARYEDKRKPFHVLVEVHDTVSKTTALKRKIALHLEKELPEINQDYDEALHNNRNLQPVVELFSVNEGPFTADPKKIKYSFVHKH